MIEHAEGIGLHNDLAPRTGDRFHWYSTTGWIMWNCQLARPARRHHDLPVRRQPARIRTPAPLWRFAAPLGHTFFGAGAAFYAQLPEGRRRAPRRRRPVARCAPLGSTGSPLPSMLPLGLGAAQVDGQLRIACISGGTDFCRRLRRRVPPCPVYAGEMQCRCLGARSRR